MWSRDNPSARDLMKEKFLLLHLNALEQIENLKNTKKHGGYVQSFVGLINSRSGLFESRLTLTQD